MKKKTKKNIVFSIVYFIGLISFIKIPDWYKSTRKKIDEKLGEKRF